MVLFSFNFVTFVHFSLVGDFTPSVHTLRRRVESHITHITIESQAQHNRKMIETRIRIRVPPVNGTLASQGTKLSADRF